MAPLPSPSPTSLETLIASPPIAPKAQSKAHRRQTTTFDEAPEYLRQNCCIRTGYRRELGCWKECVLSLGWWHNELANAWTHLLPCSFCLSVLLAGSAFALFPSLLQVYLPTLHTPSAPSLSWRAAITPVFPFPSPAQPSVTLLDTAVFGLLFAGAAVCFGLSSAYHCGLAHSEKVCSRARRADHFGILCHGSLRFIAAFHFGFYCDPYLRNSYILLMAVACAAGVYVIVLSDELQKYEYRKVRTGVFAAIGGVAVVPFGHAILRYGYEAASERMSFGWIGVELLCFLLGAIFYSERYPESLFPGKFDLLGNSHNIFHLLAVGAVAAEYAAASEGFRVVHGAAGGAPFSCLAG
ncbi:hypothetical protein JCM10213_000077 [Rhodosporidiobolus nylandii]